MATCGFRCAWGCGSQAGGVRVPQVRPSAGHSIGERVSRRHRPDSKGLIMITFGLAFASGLKLYAMGPWRKLCVVQLLCPSRTFEQGRCLAWVYSYGGRWAVCQDAGWILAQLM